MTDAERPDGADHPGQQGQQQGGQEWFRQHLRLNGFEELPGWMKDEIRKNYPAYTQAPPVDDTRPNDTTWTVFKKMVDEQRAKSGEKPKTGH